MKEKDLDKNLGNLIIEGLIKEGEQENVDFAAAMRKMSDEEFEDMVREPAFEDTDNILRNSSVEESKMFEASEAFSFEPHGATDDDWDDAAVFADDVIMPRERKRMVMHGFVESSSFGNLGPWLAAALSAAAVIIAVLVPSINSMNARLCDSAIYMSEAYLSSPRDGGFDVSTASLDQIRDQLPALEQRYDSSFEIINKHTIYKEDFQEAGWTLAVAYLKLHKKKQAVKVLKTLEEQSKGTPFGDHCAEMLKQLE